MIKSVFVVAFAIAAAAPALAAGPAMPAGDAKAGEKVFAQCKVCHVVQKGVNRVGPSLWGVVGRKSASIVGYNYSAANKKSGLTWDAPTLFKYLEAPQKLVPGTKMAFAGLKKPEDRANVIAYLALQK